MSDFKSKRQKKETSKELKSRNKNDGIPVSTEHDKRYDLEASDEFVENLRIRGETKGLQDEANILFAFKIEADLSNKLKRVSSIQCDA